MIHCATLCSTEANVSKHSTSDRKLLRQNLYNAKRLYADLPRQQLSVPRDLTATLHLSIIKSELLYLGGKWYVSHSGLLRIAHRRRCAGIDTTIEQDTTQASVGRWVFKATVHKSPSTHFVGYGDADPSNVSPLVHGAEMRVAETRAVNRALRKAYGIGICSVEEIGSFAGPVQSEHKASGSKAGKLPSQPIDGNGKHGYGSNSNGSRVRDRLCQIIRQHSLDAELVKAYAVDHCGTKTLREATREQVEHFVVHLADWAEKDRNALLCQLNSYARPQAGAA